MMIMMGLEGSLDGRSVLSQDHYLHTTTKTEEMLTDIQGTTGIRTYYPSVSVDEDISCIRPRGDSDLHTKMQLSKL
jgi:hypothetical protein